MAGETARRRASRHRAKAEALVREAAAFDGRHTGEESTARALAALPELDWRVFHDVHWPGRRYANIDHVVVGPGGVFVIDSKAWAGDVEVADGVLRQNGHRRERHVLAAMDAAARSRPSWCPGWTRRRSSRCSASTGRSPCSAGRAR